MASGGSRDAGVSTIFLGAAANRGLWRDDGRDGDTDPDAAEGVARSVCGQGNIEKHGLSRYLDSLCTGLDGIPMIAILCAVCFGILMLTELTSNTATAATFLPIAAAPALSLGENPLLFLIPVALAANCSYMLPIGTPPNAIVFGSGHVTLPQMARAGMWLNVLLVPIIIGLVMLLGRWVFGIETGIVPAWVR